MEVLPLAAHCLTRLGQQGERLASAIAALLAAANTTLGRFQRSFGLPVPARVKDARTVEMRSEGFYSKVYARLLSPSLARAVLRYPHTRSRHSSRPLPD
jgi:hypothetical protein